MLSLPTFSFSSFCGKKDNVANNPLCSHSLHQQLYFTYTFSITAGDVLLMFKWRSNLRGVSLCVITWHAILCILLIFMSLCLWKTDGSFNFYCAVEMKRNDTKELLALPSGKSSACYFQSTEPLLLPNLNSFMQVIRENSYKFAITRPCQFQAHLLPVNIGAFPPFAHIPRGKPEATLLFWFNVSQTVIQLSGKNRSLNWA